MSQPVDLTGRNVMKNFNPPIKIIQEVKLRRPHMLAAGPGTGNAGLLAVDYLRRGLLAEPFAEIEMDNFFTPPFVLRIEDGLIKLGDMEWEGDKPQNRFYYWRTGKTNDLIFFSGNAQPLPGKSSELAFKVMELARGLRVERMYIAGAFATDIHHRDEPEVMGIASNERLLAYLRGLGLPMAPPVNVAFNLNVFLTGAAMRSGIDVLGLVAEAPVYAMEQANVKAARALVRMFSRILGVEDRVDLADLDDAERDQEKKMDARIEELRDSTDEKARALLEYLEVLEKRQRERRAGAAPTPPKKAVPVPDSLKPIAELYDKARHNKAQVRRLTSELNKLSNEDRMLALKVFGSELLDLIQKTGPN
ncbi:MAG: PAC2 family protein [Chloroflexi bacterium]|nr:PAC2 family protein [Chloroflexota bacterium]